MKINTEIQKEMSFYKILMLIYYKGVIFFEREKEFNSFKKVQYYINELNNLNLDFYYTENFNEFRI